MTSKVEKPKKYDIDWGAGKSLHTGSFEFGKKVGFNKGLEMSEKHHQHVLGRLPTEDEIYEIASAAGAHAAHSITQAISKRIEEVKDEDN